MAHGIQVEWSNQAGTLRYHNNAMGRYVHMQRSLHKASHGHQRLLLLLLLVIWGDGKRLLVHMLLVHMWVVLMPTHRCMCLRRHVMLY